MLLSENVLQDKYNVEQGGYTGRISQKGQVDLPAFKACNSVAKTFCFWYEGHFYVRKVQTG
jgi:hypothetical protein